ncbi:MAG TPA: hypothetical protein VL133_02010 [Devosia sp.]|nr:hypothetical protein [Devosia sp.]
MATLHIEHGITDFSTWKAAFDRFEGMRSEAGVTAYRIHQPDDDPAYVVLQLDLPTVEQAKGFLTILETRVWSVPANSPGLSGRPQARILVSAPAQEQAVSSRIAARRSQSPDLPHHKA